MKRKKIIYLILIMLLSIFSFNMDVHAAQELTCVYKVQTKKTGLLWSKTVKFKVMLTQDSKGKINVYSNSEDVGIITNDNYWTRLNSDKYYFWDDTQEKNSNSKNPDSVVKYDGDGNLTNCPKSQVTDNIGSNNTKTIFYADDYSGTQGLIYSSKKVEKPTLASDESSSEKIPKLTCIYEQGDKSIKKVAITQDEDGEITMYKNKENVSYNDTSSYWEKSDDQKVFDDSTGYNTLGYLKQCPTSKSTSRDGKGKVTFYLDDEKAETKEGDESLEDNYDSVLTFQTDTQTVPKDDLKYDNDKNSTKTCTEIKDEDKWLTDHDNYTLACLYQASIKGYGKNADDEPGCHIIQINIGNSGVDVKDSESDFYVTTSTNSSLGSYAFFKNDITEKELLEHTGDLNSACPVTLMVNRSKSFDSFSYMYSLRTTITFGGTGTPYTLVEASGKNLATGAEASAELSYNIHFEEIKIENCEDLFGEDSETLIGMLKTGVNIVKILIPIILLALGSLDFAQAVFSSNEDGIKKAQSKFIKRLLIAVVIFLIPSILKLLLTLANSIWPIIDADLCGII